MTYEKLSELVEKLEQESKKNPGLYKLKVTLVALLGYAYIVGVLVLALTGLGLLVGIWLQSGRVSGAFIRFMVPVVLLIFYIIKSLWVKLEPPTGITLSRKDTPQLHALVEEVRKQLKTPRIHEILLVGEFNAAIVQYPRLGVFGFSKNYLILGLPLMMSMSIEELKSVIAHELGHVSGRHGRFIVAVYRLKTRWMNLVNNMENYNPAAQKIFKRFLQWYVPFYDAYSFVLLRAHEYQADRLAVEVTNVETFARALTKLNVTEMNMQTDFWRKIFRLTVDMAEPVRDIYQQMYVWIKEGIDQETMAISEAAVLRIETNLNDTHPAPVERFKAIGAKMAQSLDFSKDAFTELGLQPEQYLPAMNHEWKSSVFAYWRHQYKQFEEQKRQLEQMKAREEQEGLDFEEYYTKGELVERLEGADAAFLYYEHCLKLEPDYVPALFATGRIFLEEQNDPAGIAQIERAFKLNHHYIVEGSRVIHNYLLAKGDKERAQGYYQKAIEYQCCLSMVEERSRIRLSNTFTEHQLSEETVTKIRNRIKKVDIEHQIDTVYLIQKKVEFLQEYPLYVFGVKGQPGTPPEQDELVQKLVKEGIGLSVNFTIIFLSEFGNRQKFEELMKGINNSLIYTKH